MESLICRNGLFKQKIYPQLWFDDSCDQSIARAWPTIQQFNGWTVIVDFD